MRTDWIQLNLMQTRGTAVPAGWVQALDIGVFKGFASGRGIGHRSDAGNGDGLTCKSYSRARCAACFCCSTPF